MDSCDRWLHECNAPTAACDLHFRSEAIHACHSCSFNTVGSLFLTLSLPARLLQVREGWKMNTPSAPSSCHYFHWQDSVSQKALCTSCFSRGHSDLAAWLNSPCTDCVPRNIFVCGRGPGSGVSLRGQTRWVSGELWLEWEEGRKRGWGEGGDRKLSPGCWSTLVFIFL